MATKSKDKDTTKAKGTKAAKQAGKVKAAKGADKKDKAQQALEAAVPNGAATEPLAVQPVTPANGSADGIIAANGSTPAVPPVLPGLADLRARQASLKQKYRVRPDTALITSAVHSVTGEGGDPRRVRIAVDGPSDTVFEIGAHTAVGGDDDLPCSGDLFLASLAACQELTIRLVAASMGLPLYRLVVRVEGDWDVRGTLAVNRASPIGFTDIRVQVELDTEGPEDRIQRLLTSAERYCVVGQTLEHVPEVAFHADVTNRATHAAGAAG